MTGVLQRGLNVMGMSVRVRSRLCEFSEVGFFFIPSVYVGVVSLLKKSETENV